MLKLEINLKAIAMIESSNNPKAFNKRTGARGLYQITPVCLAEWNRQPGRERERHSLSDLFDADVSRKIANWYFHHRIPQMLDAFSIPLSIDNILISYNWGVGNLKKFIFKTGSANIPQETFDYLQKYKDLTRPCKS